MTNTEKDLDAELMYRLQRGLPIVRRPFAEVGTEVGLSEEQVIERIRGYFEEGKARRMGAIFDLRRLGYTSVLCAVAVQQEDLEEVTGKITPHDGVTHCYLRTPDPGLDPGPHQVNGKTLPNLWFTLSVLGEHFESELSAMREKVAPRQLLVLPAIRRFKINVVFDMRKKQRQQEEVPALETDQPGTARWDGVAREFTEAEKALVRAMRGNIPVESEPFSAAAREAGWQPAQALDALREWDEAGVLRRVALICRHRRIGFKANGMCTWRVPEDEALETGRALARHPEVTHCYQRVVVPEFPYNVYAMIHSGAWEDTLALFGELSKELGLEDGLLFLSTHEYKKTSPRPFSET
jgi:DNA-binding Lrp family transcriptional regulator